MNRKESEETIADSHAARVMRVGSVDELLAEAKIAGVYPLPPEEREWVDAPPVGKEWPNNKE